MNDRRNDRWRVAVAALLTTYALSAPVGVTATATLATSVGCNERIEPTSIPVPPDEEPNHNQVLL